MIYRRKLIEVALPLEDINREAAREKSIRHGHPSTLHLWWARRPLAAARAVIFAQMVDDPGSLPEEFPNEEAQEAERQRLFQMIGDLVKWENTTNERLLEAARAEIRKSWARWCRLSGEDPTKLPPFHDPFAGGGSLPLEAQRLGLEVHASDLNPVAVLINKAMIEIPPRFAGQPPVNPEARGKLHLKGGWRGTAGLADDVRYYGAWMRQQAIKRIGHFYPQATLPDGRQATVIAWLWARTVESPNPAFRGCQVPLVSSFWLSARPGKEAWVEPVVEGKSDRFEVRTGKPADKAVVDAGTKLGRGANFRCLLSSSPITPDYIKAEGIAGRMGARLMAIVAEGEHRRVYLSPTLEHEAIARRAQPTWSPSGDVPARLTGGTCVPYGMKEWGDLFTPRQLVALTTFSDLVQEVREQVKRDALAAGLPAASKPLAVGGTGASASADAVAVYLAFCLDKASLTNTTQATWQKDPDRLTQAFSRQAIPMTWDYAEANPISEAGGGFGITAHAVAKVLERLPTTASQGNASQQDASMPTATVQGCVISTDPPYYDNISYADLSDYFYVWLRRSLRPVFPDLFATLAVPKAKELIAAPYRHGSKEKAEAFFLDGMTRAMHLQAEQAHPMSPITIYYAFKQSESASEKGTASTGWDTFLDAVIRSGFAITGTWPVRTELIGNLKKQVGALASSIVLVCRPRSLDAPTATRREFIHALKSELPAALMHLQRSNIAPVDLAQAAIGLVWRSTLATPA